MFICFGVWAIFFVFLQRKVRVSKKQPTNTEKKIGGKKLWENRFLKHLRTSSRKVWTIRLNLLAGMPKLLQSVQRNNFRMFLWNEETLLKFFGRWAKLLNIWCDFYVKISQKCSLRMQHNVLSFFLERRVIVWLFSVSERQ